MNPTRLAFCMLLTVLICDTGCFSTAPVPDPLEGWRGLLHYDSDRLSQAIKDDYQDYIRTQLIPKYHHVPDYDIWFYADGTGQHAVKIDLPVNGSWLDFVLIYDKDNKRIKVVKFTAGRYRS